MLHQERCVLYDTPLLYFDNRPSIQNYFVSLLFFFAFFFAIPKTIPIFAVFNIYCQAGDVRQLLAGFFMPVTSSYNARNG